MPYTPKSEWRSQIVLDIALDNVLYSCWQNWWQIVLGLCGKVVVAGGLWGGLLWEAANASQLQDGHTTGQSWACHWQSLGNNVFKKKKGVMAEK